MSTVLMSYVQYGTAVYEKEPEAVPRWKRRDEVDRVRERFHGAFTGGFSAGYHNTVGSKEGWMPGTFHSSRKSKATITESRPENFMDEEDLQQQEESMLLVPVDWMPETSADDDPLHKLLRPTLITTGINRSGYQMLLKMGWKEGQGIGPKLSRKQQVGSEVKLYEVAPKYSTVSIQANPTKHGVGYNIDSPELPVFSSAPVSRSKPKPKRRRIAMNLSIAADYDENEVDDDVEEVGSQSKSKYDSTVGKAPKFRSKRLIKRGSLNLKCSDGSDPLEGFVLGTRPLYISKNYPMVAVPDGYRPITGPQNSSVDEGEDVTNSKQRGQLLNEAQMAGKSVFSFLTQDQRNRIASIAGNSGLPEGGSELIPSSKLSEDDIPVLSTDAAEEALSAKVFPYHDDPDKLTRYRSFLQWSAGVDSKIPQKRPHVTYDGWIKELNEFCRVALVFKPLKGDIADRFTASTKAINRVPEWAKAEGEVVEVPKKKETPAEEAARLSNYGALTYKMTDFVPEKLLCKRFGVPYPGVRETSQQEPELEPVGEPLADVKQMTDKTEFVPLKNEILEAERAPADIFEQIFGGDDDE
jgi:G patch domain-containing protein 1